MNIYLLVEGKAEKRIYKNWMQSYGFEPVQAAKDANGGKCLIRDGKGQPNILTKALHGAFAEVQEGDFQHFMVILDSEEETVQARYENTHRAIRPLIQQSDMDHAVIVQHRCVETWLLGNRKMPNEQPSDAQLIRFRQFYDVVASDPELMPASPEYETHAKFHKAYVKAIFRERGTSYSERFPRHAASSGYLAQLQSRIEETPHLNSFRDFHKLMTTLTAGT